MFRKILPALFILILTVCGATAEAQETEAAASSKLTATSLPANAQRVLPASVPAEVAQTLEKIVTAGNGKLRQGETEVLVWTSPNYQKTKTDTIINSLADGLKIAGWQYEVSGAENGLTVFTAFKEGANRRALVGFHGATDDALIFAWTELLPVSGVVKQAESNSPTERVASHSIQNSGDLSELVGSWHNGNVSMMQDKNLTTGQTTPSNGSTYTYKFFADGRFEYVGYMKSTMYGCTTDLFNDKRGKIEIVGSKIIFIPSKNYWKNTYSCSPASNKERNYTLERVTYDWHTKTDEYGRTLVCLTNAKGESCYRREEKQAGD